MHDSELHPEAMVMPAPNTDVYILDGARTPFGSFGGSFKDTTATDLGVVAAEGAMAKAGIEPGQIDQVFFGNVMQTSSDAIYIARHVGLRSGIPEAVPALTLNRLCGSGTQAIISGAQAIMLNEASIVLAGGAENMSQAPFLVRGARWGLRLGSTGFDDYLWESLTDSYCGADMATTAENLAGRFGISRKETDEYALRSQQRTQLAKERCYMSEEIVPVTVKGRKGLEAITEDEHPRPDTTLEALGKLKPYFKADGVVTAGNASGIVDGAAAVVLAAGDKLDGHKPLGRILSWAVVGVEPKVMGIGPARAIPIALERAGVKLENIDLIEINEAFSAQYLAVEKDLGLDRKRVNVNGGAIAIGHPLGASGTRLPLTLLRELRRRGGGIGVASACIGGGQGIALVVEATA
jgi:acetyl-CoA acyltransferase 2